MVFHNSYIITFTFLPSVMHTVVYFEVVNLIVTVELSDRLSDDESSLYRPTKNYNNSKTSASQIMINVLNTAHHAQQLLPNRQES